MSQKTLHQMRIAAIVASEIEELAPRFFPLMDIIKDDTHTTGVRAYRYAKLSDEAIELQIQLSEKYLDWCKDCEDLMRKVDPDKRDEFEHVRQRAVEIIDLKETPRTPNTHKLLFEFNKNMKAQKTILSYLSAKLATGNLEIDEEDEDEGTTSPTESISSEECVGKEVIFAHCIKPVLDEELLTFRDAALDKTLAIAEDISTLCNNILNSDYPEFPGLDENCSRLADVCQQDSELKDMAKPLLPLLKIVASMSC
ncbi:MAG: hypothetical protein U9N13_07000 [Euryarchaeota archaeon]|nr:hypothetical protein [Euryarchaeota archaeon]